MDDTPRFQALKPWLQQTFGRPTFRVALDAGSSCPNRDGSRGFGGCTYCDVEGSGTGALRSGKELTAQLEAGIERVRRRTDDPGVIAYFQSYSNTYVSRERLREVLHSVEPFLGDPVVAVSIATRPDTLPDEALETLAELGRRTSVWVELGLETADDRILDEIRRFHTVADFEEAVARCRSAGLLTVGHAILGLPGDGREGARNTARVLARCGVEGVKVHNLMVLRRTQMEKSWRRGELEVLDADTYVDWLADFVERLRPDQILHRMTGDAPLEERLAPRWDLHMNAVRDRLVAELSRRGTRQGARLPATNARGRESGRSSGTA